MDSSLPAQAAPAGPSETATQDGACGSPEEAAQQLLSRAQQPSSTKVLDLLQMCSSKGWTNDDELYVGVSILLKGGADVSDACKACEPRSPQGEACSSSQQPPHEVAWLTKHVATRTLALLLKQRPACQQAIKHRSTLQAAVLSNKEYTLLFLSARGADFHPHLESLITDAIRGGAAKTLPWLLQWQEMTSQKLQQALQAGLPEPSPDGCAGTAAMLEVLLLHGLSPNCTLSCNQQGGPPSPSGPNLELPLLEWAVLHAATAAKLQADKQARSLPPSPPRAGSPPVPTGAGDTPSNSNSTTPSRPLSEMGRTESLTKSSRAMSWTNLRALVMKPLASSPARARRPSNGCVAAQQEAADAAAPSQLLKVVLSHGAAVNANSGAALLRAAQMLQGGLVGELVSAGADVALPRIGSNQDLLRWAVDTRQCPTHSGVLQALLSGVKGSTQGAKPPSAASSRPGTPPRARENDATNGAASPESTKGRLAAKAGPVQQQQQQPQQQGLSAPKPSAATPALQAAPVCAGVASPMIVVGGGQAADAKAAEQAQLEEHQEDGSSHANGTNGKAGDRGARGSFLPAALLTELQRDEAFLDAVLRNDLVVVQCLLEAGADVHYKQDKAILLAMGALDPNNPDYWMPRPRDRAPVLSMSRPMVELLLAHGADVNARKGRALCQAARWKDDYSIKYILSLPGADASLMERASAPPSAR